MANADRLTIFFLIHDAQASIAQHKPPLVSPAELTQELPASRDLWCAATPQAWRHAYLSHSNAMSTKGFPISQSISHVSQIRPLEHLDRPLSALIAVYCTCSAVWNHSQLHLLVNPQPPNLSGTGVLLASGAWDSGLPKLLDQLRLIFSDWDDIFVSEITLVFERILLSLHVSFDQVQLFAGKEGEDEARRAFPLLRHWSTTSDARKAVWHAGQILKAASRCPPKYLREFQAVCLYHAGLTFWTYAVISASSTENKPYSNEFQRTQVTSSPTAAETVWLDGDDCTAVQRFIALNRGTPAVHDLAGSHEVRVVNPIHLNNPKAIMNICIRLLKLNSPVVGDGTQLPLVDNLSQLMHDLGNAAQEFLHGKRNRDGHAVLRQDG